MQVVYANKALLLHRIFEREIQGFASEKNIFCLKLEDALTNKSLRDRLPQFIVRVFDAKNGERIHLRGIRHKDEFIKFLEFAYCDKLVEPVSR